MSRNTAYVQCTLVHVAAESTFRITSWIPKRFAHVGKCLRLRQDDRQWQDGWLVQSVGTTVLTENELPDSHKAVRSHRRSTGDSLSRKCK
jgi:hypothetical protein